MKITEASLRYKNTVVALTLMVFFGGLIAYFTIPKESTPSIEIPLFTVQTVYPGVSPKDVETLITKPLETEIQTISGIDKLSSVSNEGFSNVTVQFEPNVSIDEAYQKVRDKVDAARIKFPSDVKEPKVTELDFSEFPILTVNLGANYSLLRLKEIADDLKQEIEGVPGILSVDITGALEQEVKVEGDLTAMTAYNVAFSDITQAIQQENTNIPGGSVKISENNYLIRTDGQILQPQELEDIIVKMPIGQAGQPTPGPIYLRDVAKVNMGFKERKSYARLKIFKYKDDKTGKLYTIPENRLKDLNVISLSIKKRSGENILSSVDGVKEVIDKFKFPKGTFHVLTGDQSEQVRVLVEDLENNVVSGVIFVIATLLFFLGLRASLLVGIAIPLSMTLSFLVFAAMGTTMNFVILFSLIVALGMLVDNAIVIVENIYRYRENGYDKMEAARLGTNEVGSAIVASSATNLAPFIPMLFWPGIIGKFMGYLPLTLIITLLSSLFVAIVMNPVFTGMFIKLDDEKSEKLTKWARITAISTVALLALIIGFQNPITLLVIVILGVGFWLFNKFFLDKVVKSFLKNGIPKMNAGYQKFVANVLKRNYQVKWAYFRNTAALVALTCGAVVALLALAVPAVLKPIFFALAGLCAGLGVLGIFIHTIEGLLRGGKATMKAGVYALIVVFLLIGYLYLKKESLGDTFFTIVGVFLAIPLALLILGFMGRLFKLEHPLLITDNRALLINMTLGSLLIIVGLFAAVPTGVEFFPATDPRQISIKVEAPLGSTLQHSNNIAFKTESAVDALVRKNPDSKANFQNVLTNVGSAGGGNPMMQGPPRAEVSNLTINFVDFEERKESTKTTLALLRDQLAAFPGATFEFVAQQSGPPRGAPVNIEISGPEFSEIVRISKRIKKKLQDGAKVYSAKKAQKDPSLSTDSLASLSGLVDVKDNLSRGQSELQVRIDRERAQQYRLNTSQIASLIRTAIAGSESGKYRTGEDEYDITVRLQESDRSTLESLQNLTIPVNVNGNPNDRRQLPLSAVADFELGGGLGSITRLDNQRVITVSGNTAPGYAGPQVLTAVQAFLRQETLPAGYNLKYTGENEDMQKSFGFLGNALLMAIALIFIVLIAQFNRVGISVLIMIAYGLSLIGVMLGLIITRTPFGLMTFIGVVSLGGIVVNNALVLVDYILQLQEEGKNIDDAIIEGGTTRLRPVMLGALSNVIGLIPLAIGLNIDFVGLFSSGNANLSLGSENNQFWGPLGNCLIYGLAFSTFLTLVIVPAMFSSFESLNAKLKTKFKPQVLPKDWFEKRGSANNTEVPLS